MADTTAWALDKIEIFQQEDEQTVPGTQYSSTRKIYRYMWREYILYAHALSTSISYLNKPPKESTETILSHLYLPRVAYGGLKVTPPSLYHGYADSDIETENNPGGGTWRKQSYRYMWDEVIGRWTITVILAGAWGSKIKLGPFNVGMS